MSPFRSISAGTSDIACSRIWQKSLTDSASHMDNLAPVARISQPSLILGLAYAPSRNQCHRPASDRTVSRANARILLASHRKWESRSKLLSQLFCPVPEKLLEPLWRRVAPVSSVLAVAAPHLLRATLPAPTRSAIAVDKKVILELRWPSGTSLSSGYNILIAAHRLSFP